MKVFVIYDAPDAPPSLHHKLAITLPAKWLGQSVDKVRDAFLGAYNKKFPDNVLVASELVLSVKDPSPFARSTVKILRTTDTPESSFEDRGEVRVCRAVATSGPDGGGSAHRCKNYGCQAEFDEACNDETSCRHHTLPPVFQDLRKWWGCCEDKKVYSFEELLALPGCAVGKHSTTPPAKELERTASLASATQKALALHENASKPSQDGRAPPPSNHSSQAAAAPPKRRTRPATLGASFDRCQHYGCQVDYATADNHAQACRYHPGAPIFHEGSKQWPCCAVKKWDFDDFMAVPGCVVAEHEPVVWDN
jgi:hypothetical protein